jgi:hypothetical protein
VIVAAEEAKEDDDGRMQDDFDDKSLPLEDEGFGTEETCCRCQVAAKYIPPGSLVLGVDLMAIKALRVVETMVGDTTTASCRKDIVQNYKDGKLIL